MIQRRLKPDDIIFGGGIIDRIVDTFTAQRYSGERHAREGLTGRPYNFVGPGTNLSRRLERRTGLPKRSSFPINRIDEDAMRHDIRYGEIAEQYYQNPTPENKRQKLAEIHGEDRIFIENVQQHRADDPIVADTAAALIRAKKFAEEHGLLDSRRFSGFGKKQKPADPAKRLRQLVLQTEKPKKEDKKKIEGGFAPIVVPVVTAIASTLVGKLFDTIKEKLSGNGIKLPFKYYQNKKKFIDRLIKANKRIIL